jgi:hypothetical protein
MAQPRAGAALFRLVMASVLLALILGVLWVFMLIAKVGPG